MRVVFNRDTYELPHLLFEKLAVERGYVAWRHAAWRTSEQHLDGLTGVGFRYTDVNAARSVHLDRETALALVCLDRHSKVDLWVAAADDASLIRLVEEVRTGLPERADGDGHELAMRFWTMGMHRPDDVVRNVSVPTWDEIRHNYGGAVTDVLDRLMRRREPPAGGQLMLWHGPPGTGKTHAIRALAREWRDWARAEYVVDPEAFFGGSASYIMSLLLGNDDEDDDEGAEKWRLLIFEDTGELLSADARERVGQGLSRLLNTVDGLLGQGLRVLLLITTNEELGKLHPAVTRPGRAAINVRFGPLDAARASEWLQRHGLDEPTGLGPMTLADLYALADGRELTFAQPQPIGFASPRP